MRIGIDCRLWNETGVGRYTRNLVKYLSQIDTKNTYVLFLQKSEIETINLPGQNFIKKEANIRWHSLSEQILYSSILKKEQLDLMHFPYFSVPVFYNRPYVITIHDLILNHFDTGQASTLPAYLYKAKRIGYNFVISNAIKNARKIITVSEATKKEIIQHYNVLTDKIVVTYEGYDENLTSSDKNSLIKNDYFLYVGNAYPHKNLDMLLEAFRILHDQNSDIQLVCVGKTDYFYKKLQEKIKQIGLSSQVILYGYASDKDLANLYKNAKAFIFPSKMEGFGLPILEALANKCIVIASKIPVTQEIAKETVLYFEPENVLDLKNKMADVLAGNIPKNLVKDGLDRVSQFSWEKMAKETLSVYNSSVNV